MLFGLLHAVVQHHDPRCALDLCRTVGRAVELPQLEMLLHCSNAVLVVSNLYWYALFNTTHVSVLLDDNVLKGSTGTTNSDIDKCIYMNSGRIIDDVVYQYDSGIMVGGYAWYINSN